MKKCVDCDAGLDDGAYACPRCGGESFIGSYAAEDALAVLQGRTNQLKAKEHVDRAAHLYVAGCLAEAIAELEAAIRLAPLNPTAHGNMGAVLLKQGKARDAVPWLERALELKPSLEGVPGALVQARAAAAEGELGRNSAESPDVTSSAPSASKRSDCLVAAVCFGDAESREVRALRRFRDQRLVYSGHGRWLVRQYERWGPAWAAWLERRPATRERVRRWLLGPLVCLIDRIED